MEPVWGTDEPVVGYALVDVAVLDDEAPLDEWTPVTGPADVWMPIVVPPQAWDEVTP